ncbi:MAG: hypothetical protein COX39_02195 [Candidatus Nealsonbacteria bacterium CG23_combo_of_CG06-09_8_20_14_all_40_13]|uniref:SbsA Ig-like domain-containing protein n=1 Tax=Candidatus Nealsonbacteria bacterium CG23_combo_of_CG06-09_8_20_14_all_40_13 TaxID=1974724 RepID=A0A2G9YSU7_9BACT|nr:MAG: hypothetical protein COX39_02195 [Candidatus Nealsonbacteria bacterium CG23_combo_of_CG06-09_8_20_14_all_40_13]PIR71210.1 MAG: hypothetical protein COU44_01140 [Candidatus Nealsonbacteria bacterium CG10_big_fil_rev_8_21_14_0_10_40_24]PIU43114.1 MAG: hypothetical protein COS97_02855 [Candidatus Nealsonbacteria bacterium CG07_land_8_20_14_0_80_40_10]
MSKKALVVVLATVLVSSVFASYIGYNIAKNSLKAESTQTQLQSTSSESPTNDTNLPFLQGKKITDTTQPEIISVTPATGAQGVAKDVAVTIKFSKSMDKTTLDSSTIYVYEQKNQTLLNNLLNFSYDDSQNSLFLTFQKEFGDWGSGNTISITLTTGILDSSGNPLNEAKTWQFSTE